MDGGFFNGVGMLVIRDPSSTAPATLGGDFVLTRPVNGWRGTVTATEYLCFHDPNRCRSPV